VHCCVGRVPFGFNCPACRSGSVQLPSCVLYGLDGMGKTEIAVEYAYRYSYDYDLV